MQVYKAYKFRMYPNYEQEILLNKFLGASRFIYNNCLSYILENQKKSNRINFSSDLEGVLIKLKTQYQWIDEVDPSILITTLEDLDNGYKRYFSGKAEIPKFKSKKSYYDSYRTICKRWNYMGKENSNIKLDMKNKILTLPKIKNIKIRGYRKLKEFSGRIINATVSKIAGKYYVSVAVKEEIKNDEFKLSHAIGLDIGIKDIIVTSDGEKYGSLLEKQKRLEKRLDGLHKGLNRMQKDSNNYKKMQIKIKKLNMRIKNSKKFAIHEITKKIIRENDIIIVEDLKTKELINKNSRYLSREISKSCFSEIIRQLSYKADWYNKRLIKIERFYPSSQLCSFCKAKNVEVQNLKVRKYTCKNCGRENDRDINASINILDRGMELYLKSGEVEKFL